MDQHDVVKVIENLLESDDSYVEKLQPFMPTHVDISKHLEEIRALQRQYERAFPNTRWGSNRDKYAYNRMCPQLMKFKVFHRSSNKIVKCEGKILEYLKLFKEMSQYETLNDFCAEVFAKFKKIKIKDFVFCKVLKAKKNKDLFFYRL